MLQTTQRNVEKCILGLIRRGRKRIERIRNQTRVFDIIERKDENANCLDTLQEDKAIHGVQIP